MASITRRNQRTRAERRAEIRRQLLVAVERLLAEGETFTELSVERLVSEGGISRSTFYVYFEDKGDLLRGWFEDIRAGLNVAADRWWRLGPGTRYEDIRDVLADVVTAYRPHSALMAATFDTAAYDANVRELVEEMMSANAAGLRKHIRVGQSEGFVDPGIPPGETASWLTWMAERGLHQLVSSANNGELEELIDAYARIIWNTLYAPAAPQ
jgi:AcrR family transcriptional regulator